MKYNNALVTEAKRKLIARISYILNIRLNYTSGAAIAKEIQMSNNIVSKLRNNVNTGISFEAVLEAAKRLNLKFSVSLEHDGRGGENVYLTMEDLADTHVRIGRQVTHANHPGFPH
jgi:hypothetical protein